jgi:diphosphate--fructose-6-phosphate 1-phosphotransferase
MNQYRNQGGFDMICSGRHKIEKPEEFEKSVTFCTSLKLDGLIVIGGDDSNTNACLLAEYFKKNNCATKVVGVPKTIDGDLKNEWIEVSFGFDTATRVYSELIGNISLDTLSSKKYYHFIRLMGRSASHIALECALLTQANIALIGEEVEAKKQTLSSIVNELADVICKRAADVKNYGVILVPEGLIEFIPEVKVLIKEINEILSKPVEGNITEFVLSNLSNESNTLFKFLPNSISEQLLLDRDPHGNVQVAKIDTERLLILLLQTELENRKKEGKYVGKFSPQSHYFGYEGRCALPSYFDTEYCYGLGYNAGALVSLGLNGYMSVLRHLSKENPSNWIPAGCPLMTMMGVERRKGKDVPVIKKALVELDGPLFKFYEAVRNIWALNDSYIQPGPIQYEGPCAPSCPYLVNPPKLDNIDLDKFIIKPSDKNTPYAPKNANNLSKVTKFLLNEQIKLPNILTCSYKVKLTTQLGPSNEETKHAFSKYYSNTENNYHSKFLAEIMDDTDHSKTSEDDHIIKPVSEQLNIGIVYSGRQAPGGNNIVNGLLEFKKRNGNTKLFGFLYGTLGMFNGNYIEITEENFALYKNQGGYDFLGRSVDKIRSEEELKKTKEICEKLNLNGLVIVGATHSLTDSLLLTEYLLANKVKTSVIAVPCTVDGNISHPLFETAIGFDTASKVYSQLIGNIMTDSASATKYWYLIRLMGRDPSHLVLESALQTHPNYVIISEECSQRGQNLDDIVNDICDVISERANQKKNFGTILIPEGLLAHLPHFKTLIEELNEIFCKNIEKEDISYKLLHDESFLKSLLSPWSSAVFLDLPEFTKKQLLLEREAHGTIQLSQIETERLISYKISKVLEKRKQEKKYKGAYSAITHFFGKIFSNF